MKTLYNETARDVHGIAHEFPTAAQAWKHRDRLRADGYTVDPTPRAYDDTDGRRVYIVYAWRYIATA